MFESPGGFRHQEEEAGETTPRPLCGAIRLASEKIIPAGGRVFTKFGRNRQKRKLQPAKQSSYPDLRVLDAFNVRCLQTLGALLDFKAHPGALFERAIP